MIPITTIFDADIAVVGGGVGGPMAAIAARETGAKKVVLLEKCHVRRSGSGATGNEYFSCYIPEVHGDDLEPVLEQFMGSIVGLHKDPALMRLHLEESFALVKKWEAWGIDMRPTGKWHVAGQTASKKRGSFLKYNGRQQKAVLARQLDKHDVTILNHHPVVELTLDASGRVAGLLAINMNAEDPAFTVIRTANVILATGLAHRLYASAPTPAYMFNTGQCPNCAGGQGLGWRIGAKMVNMELPYTYAGPRYLPRANKAGWIGVYRYSDSGPLRPLVAKTNVEYGDVTADIWNPGVLDADLSALLDYREKHTLDPSKDALKLMRYEPILHGRGLEVDKDGKTAVPGLYAVGDMVGNAGYGIGLAVWMGWRSGSAAARDAVAGVAPREPAEQLAQIREKMALLSACMERPSGPDWKEANIALQQIMGDYVPTDPYHARSAAQLEAGLVHLRNLKQETLATVKAQCSHTLMRTAEVLDLFDCGEAILAAALERKETPAQQKRMDFPFPNSSQGDKMLTTQKQGDTIVTEWRPKLTARM